MKKSLNLAKIVSLIAISVTVVSVTFFVTGLVVAATSTWVGPILAPPGGNPPGFIFNALSGGSAQNADINISGTGTFGDINVVDNANSTGSIIVGNQICFHGTTDCTDTFKGLSGSDNIWAKTGSAPQPVTLINADDLVHIGNPVSADPNDKSNKIKLYINGSFGHPDGSTILHLWGSQIADAGGLLSLTSASGPLVLNPDNNGNVGVGTNKPDYKFHVVGNVGAAGLLTPTLENRNVNGGVMMQLVNGAAPAGFGLNGPSRNVAGASYLNNWAWMTNDNSNGGLAFLTGCGDPGCVRMVLTPTGKLGIGTNQPQAWLDVNGTSFWNSNPATGGGNVEMQSYYNSDITWPTSNLSNPSRSTYGSIFGGGLRVNEYYDGTAKTIKKTRQGPSGTIEMKEWGDWNFIVSSDAAAGAVAPNRKMALTIKNDGRVGIMTSGNDWNDGTQMIDGSLNVFKQGGGGAIDIYGTQGPWSWDGIRLWNGGMKWDADDGSINGNGNKYWGIWHQTALVDPTVSGPDDFRINEYTGTGSNHVEALTLQSMTGKMGLLVTKPTTQLDIGGEGTVKLAQRTTAPNPTTSTLYNLNGKLYWGATQLNSGSSTSTWTQTGNNLYPTTLGSKVGIGTATPASIFHIVGYEATGAGLMQTIENTNSAATNAFAGLSLKINGVKYADISGGNAGGAGWDIVNGLNLGAGTSKQDIGFRVGPSIDGTGGKGPAMIIKSSGKVGIGTATPKTNLEVNSWLLVSGAGARVNLGHGTDDPNSSIVWVMDNYQAPGANDKLFRIFRQDNLNTNALDWQNYFFINPAGNVGIGNPVPAQKLDVAGNIKASGTICDGSGNCLNTSGPSNSGWTDAGAVVNLTTATDSVNIGGTSNNNLKLYVNGDFGRNNGAATMWLYGSKISDMGGAILNIIPGGNPGNVNIQSGSGSSMIYTQGSTQRVGIGTTEPAEKLDVVGNIKSSGDIKSGRVFAGSMPFGLGIVNVNSTGPTLNFFSALNVGVNSSVSGTSDNAYGVYASASGGTAANYGVYGYGSGTNSFGGYFLGGTYSDRFCLGGASNCITSWPGDGSGPLTAKDNLTVSNGSNFNVGIKYKQCNSVTTCTCDAGQYLITGGVECASGQAVRASYPKNDLKTWYGTCDSTPLSIRISCVKGNPAP
ncbi:MAG: hypothetical protein PHW95_02930 [Patescibacteria group bacterium]|nr:hypothetical protein [Patescibacteria group bacterium]